MAQLPENHHTTSAAIVRWYESKPQEHRPHMGASLIGHECERYVWLTWRWVLTPSFKGRILRLFDTGKREESRIIEELRGIGATVWDTDESGNQWRVSAINGHFGGSLDGVARGLPEAPKSTCVLEFKTHSDKSFNELLKLKVQLAKPQHYDQMQVYMGLMEIDRAMYIAVNKNTDDVYCEWIHFDKDRFYVLKERARYLIEAPNPPVKISDDPAYYICKMCSMWAHCHGGLAAEANCRTCCHATPVENAAWNCQLHNGEITTEMQRQGCGKHLMIPTLVPYGEAIDGDQTWIAYKHRTSGAYFVNGTDVIKEYGPNFTSVELHRCPGALLERVAELKNEFPGSTMVSGSVTNPNTTGFEDMPNDLDNVEVKPESPKKREARRKNEAYIQALQKMAGDQ